MIRGMQEQFDFLIDVFCKNDEEQDELRKWIVRCGVAKAYHMIIILFYNDDEQRTLP